MRILVLSTWFPYPVDQGSKIRAYALIRALAEQHELALVSFEDRPTQPEWLDHMRRYCRRIEVVRRSPFDFSRRGTVQGWFSTRPSAVVGGYSPEMSACVRQVAAEWQPELVLAITYVTAPYALEVRGVARAIDIDNLTAYMLLEQAAGRRGLGWARRYLAYWKMLQYERWLFRVFDLCLVVSERDEGRVREHFGAARALVGLVRNGVDLDYYQPGPAPAAAGRLIFNGALTYYPNFNAMKWFLGEIYPTVRAQEPGADLWITGNNSRVRLEDLPDRSQVTFTGYLDDIRPAVASSQACVVPLLQGAGTRLKILEALALGTPVISTPKGAEGLAFEHGRHLLVAESAGDFARETLRVLQDPALRAALAEQGRALVAEQYDWRQIGARLRDLVAETCARARKRGPNAA